MKILWTSHNWNPETPILLKDHDLVIPKEDIEDVHEFSRENLLENLPVDVLVVNDFKFKIDKEIIDNVRVIFTRTTGTDHIDVEWCKDMGIEVVNLKGEELREVTAVPELCIGKMIELLRMGTPGYELKGKTLGVIGKGRIGNQFVEYAKVFGMKIFWYDSVFKEQPIERLQNLLKNSDIVSLHITASEENRNFFNLEKFEQMKNGSFFLNSSRGWLVDESALKWALEDGPLNGAWSDFPVSFTHPALLVTNHVAGNTFESASKTEEILVDKLIRWYNDKKLTLGTKM